MSLHLLNKLELLKRSMFSSLLEIQSKLIQSHWCQCCKCDIILFNSGNNLMWSRRNLGEKQCTSTIHEDAKGDIDTKDVESEKYIVSLC